MTLRRTKSSYLSMHVFYKTDLIVFCEGGASKTAVEALSISSDTRTLDTIFWHSILYLHGLQKQAHFKSVGSKATLTEIAADIDSLKISTIAICLDSDYDRLNHTALNYSRVFYTYGYSWESDVMSKGVLFDILLTMLGFLSDEALREFEQSMMNLERDLASWCEIDISLKRKNKPSLFERKNPLSSIDMTKSPPTVCHDRLQDRLKSVCGYKRKPHRTVSVTSDDSMRLAFGKMVSKACYHIVADISKKEDEKSKIDYTNFMKMAIKYTMSAINGGELKDLSNHYKIQTSRL